MKSLKICYALLLLATGTLLYGPDFITYDYNPTLKIFDQFESENKQEEQATTATKHELENVSDKKSRVVQSSLTNEQRTQKIAQEKKLIAQVYEKIQPRLTSPTVSRNQLNQAINQKIKVHENLKEELEEDLQNPSLSIEQKKEIREIIANLNTKITELENARNNFTTTNQQNILPLKSSSTAFEEEDYTMPSDIMKQPGNKGGNSLLSTMIDRFIQWVKNFLAKDDTIEKDIIEDI